MERLEAVLFTKQCTALPATIFFSPQEVCHQYWPDGSTNGVQKYGEYSVSVLQATEQDGFIERVINITNPKVMDKEHMDINTNNCSRNIAACQSYYLAYICA